MDRPSSICDMTLFLRISLPARTTTSPIVSLISSRCLAARVFVKRARIRLVTSPARLPSRTMRRIASRASASCAKGFIEYLKHELSRVPLGEGILPVYVSEIEWANKRNRTGCPIVSYSLLDQRDAFRGVTGSAARPTAVNDSYR
jgi:hypothetical protein